MKSFSKLFMCSMAFAFLLLSQAFGQSPEAFKYQAVIRDANYAPLAGKSVKIRLSILEASELGPIIYQEFHSVTTSSIGLVSLNVGEGTVISGVFANIAWENYDHFLQVEVDQLGGTNYKPLGTAQLLSVPYALHATTADYALNDADGDSTNELQQLILNGNELSISKGNTVTLPGADLIAGDGISIDSNVVTNLAPSPWQIKDSVIFVDTNRVVGIGFNDTTAFPEDANLFVNGNVRLSDGGKLLRVGEILGFRGIRFSGRPLGADDFVIDNAGRSLFNQEVGVNRVFNDVDFNVRNDAGHPTIFQLENSNGEAVLATTSNGRTQFNREVGVNQTFSFVDLNIRNAVGNSTVFQVEDTSGNDLFEIGRDGNVGINQITNNVTLNVQNKTNGTNNIIMNVERANGDNVLQVQDDQDVVITGDFSVNSGTKNFILDHPLDPANKILAHNAVESPDHVTYYHGSVQLDANGKAVVDLPHYFEALNADFHYQLTCVGAFAQVYISSEIQNNQFEIAGGKAGMKVSWQVSARRNDPWAKDHPYQAEEMKDPQDQGKYYYPEGYGKGRAFKIGSNINGEDE